MPLPKYIVLFFFQDDVFPSFKRKQRRRGAEKKELNIWCHIIVRSCQFFFWLKLI